MDSQDWIRAIGRSIVMAAGLVTTEEHVDYNDAQQSGVSSNGGGLGADNGVPLRPSPYVSSRFSVSSEDRVPL